MKTAFTLAALLACSPAFSQSSTDGNIILQNFNIAVSPGATTGGSNNNGTYNVPFYQYENDNGAGLLPGGAKLALFLTGQSTPLATAILGTTPGTSPYTATPFSQPVTIPGWAPGTTPSLTIKVWSGNNNTYEDALASGNSEWFALAFTAPPLGGTPAGGTPIQTPTLTGFGDPNGQGFHLFLPEPGSIALGILGLGVLLLHRRK